MGIKVTYYEKRNIDYNKGVLLEFSKKYTLEDLNKAVEQYYQELKSNPKGLVRAEVKIHINTKTKTIDLFVNGAFKELLKQTCLTNDALEISKRFNETDHYLKHYANKRCEEIERFNMELITECQKVKR